MKQQEEKTMTAITIYPTLSPEAQALLFGRLRAIANSERSDPPPLVLAPTAKDKAP